MDEVDRTHGKIRVTRGKTNEKPVLSVGVKRIAEDMFMHMQGRTIAEGKPILDSHMRDLLSDAFEVASHFENSKEHLLAAQIADGAFESITPIWIQLMENGRTTLALQLWNETLSYASAWVDSNRKHVHRGTAFYFAAASAWKAGNLDLGFRLLHSALEDDRILNEKIGRTSLDFPAYYTASLVDNQDNFLYHDVKALRQELSSRLETYAKEFGTTYNLSQFEEDFLQNPAVDEARFLFTYCLLWLTQWESYSKSLPESDLFSKLRRLNIYWLLSLIVDKVLQQKTHKRTLGGSVHWIFETKLNIPRQSINALAKMGGHQNQWEVDFEKALGDFLNTSLDPKQASLIVAWGMRNHGAHSLVAPDMLISESEPILRRLLGALFYSASLDGT